MTRTYNNLHMNNYANLCTALHQPVTIVPSLVISNTFNKIQMPTNVTVEPSLIPLNIFVLFNYAYFCNFFHITYFAAYEF